MVLKIFTSTCGGAFVKTKIASLLLAGSVVAAAAWYVCVPKSHLPDPVAPAQAEAVPEKQRETVQKGLDYLAGQQFKDGHWEGEGGNDPVAMTGLAGLALHMETEIVFHPWALPRRTAKPENKGSACIRKAVDWLLTQSQDRRDGLIYSEHASETSRYMLGHGLATIFLAGVCENETDVARRKKLTEVITRAVKYIAVAQSTQGGWHDTSRVEGHDFANVQATVVQFQALQAAVNAGIPVPQETIRDAREYLKMAMEKGAGPAETAGTLACLGRSEYGGSDFKLPQKWFEDCRSRIPVGRDLKLGRDELAHYYLAQAEHQLGGDAWKAYRTAMFDRLQESQSKDGSWPAGFGTWTGQVYSTAVWCTVLQLDHNSHPSRERSFAGVD
jgi:hypothetical protein